MLENILTTLRNQLSVYLKNRLGPDFDEPVLINKLVNEDGSSTLLNVNAVVLSLVNIQQENMTSRVGGAGGNRPIHLNLYILFSACFTKRYLDSFKYLSAVLSFFQANPVISHTNAPGLSTEVSKLTFEIENLDTASVSQLWGAMGAKHLPFIFYKVRMVSINEPTGGGTGIISGLNT